MAIIKFFPLADGRHAVEIDGHRVPDVLGFKFEASLERDAPFQARVLLELSASADSSIASDAHVAKRRPVLNPGRPVLNPGLT